ncbi:MAG: YlxM family DNA-binding protein [Anaerovoracaceae bacterium]
MEELTRINLLYDFYGDLLSSRQKEVITLYYQDNLSLAEIGTEFGISRQAAHDALKNGQKALENYEKKLHLYDNWIEQER